MNVETGEEGEERRVDIGDFWSFWLGLARQCVLPV